ncbi:hypothetical protein TVAG_266990 [Trichomonas vaginalis G3]|uniref:Uncharacterized protein n=1 Tax=Trichomonas vaginalis (strain ATCC PRA-98 / G3) TaxID=412133 RepID=A2DQQ2_TRIV3|nr:hypothetical protein TVAG_266990 [Trichomonas vaginalis G3]|eukprot:XP_001329559.1 hypothetical protein [Trichomonas vaginalis G3]
MDLNSFTPYEELAGVYNKYVDDMINEALSDNRNALSKEKLMKITYSECYLNSITAAIGKQNKGKTLTILKQIIIIANTSPHSHVLIYINRSGSPSDDTFESLKHLIKIPIIYLSQEEAEDYLKNFLMYKELYNTIKKQGLEDKIIDKQRDELFETLSIGCPKVCLAQT